MQDNTQNISECTISHLCTSLVETRSLYNRRNKQHELELQLNSMSDLYPLTFQPISYTHQCLQMQPQLWHTISHRRSMCTVLGALLCQHSHVLPLSVSLNFSFNFMSNCSGSTSGIKLLAKVWHVNVKSFVLLLSFN